MARVKANTTSPQHAARQIPSLKANSRSARRNSSEWRQGRRTRGTPSRRPRRKRSQQLDLPAPPSSAQGGTQLASGGGTAKAVLAQKVKDLVRLAQEQGYLTYGDITEALPENLVGPEELDEIYVRLRNLDVEIVDQAEVDRVKQPEPEGVDEKARLDILDDPVRMYL